jgi:anaerobic magnesium-protoporphyrin IX monomethyl ester cyclase
MLGCLRAFAKTTFEKRFYDIGRVNMAGKVELGFDESRVFTREEIARMKEERPELVADTTFGGAIPRRFDPELVKHQAENSLNLPLEPAEASEPGRRDPNKQVGC